MLSNQLCSDYVTSQELISKQSRAIHTIELYRCYTTMHAACIAWLTRRLDEQRCDNTQGDDRSCMRYTAWLVIMGGDPFTVLNIRSWMYIYRRTPRWLLGIHSAVFFNVHGRWVSGTMRAWIISYVMQEPRVFIYRRLSRLADSC